VQVLVETPYRAPIARYEEKKRNIAAVRQKTKYEVWSSQEPVTRIVYETAPLTLQAAARMLSLAVPLVVECMSLRSCMP
jgi:hypothetical protein